MEKFESDIGKTEIDGQRFAICTCECHVRGMAVMHCVPCCEHCYEKFASVDAETFIARYCENSGITREYYDAHFVCAPCGCGDGSCKGWATLPRHAPSIISHLQLYAPWAILPNP